MLMCQHLENFSGHSMSFVAFWQINKTSLYSWNFHLEGKFFSLGLKDKMASEGMNVLHMNKNMGC